MTFEILDNGEGVVICNLCENDYSHKDMAPEDIEAETVDVCGWLRGARSNTHICTTCIAQIQERR